MKLLHCVVPSLISSDSSVVTSTATLNDHTIILFTTTTTTGLVTTQLLMKLLTWGFTKGHQLIRLVLSCVCLSVCLSICLYECLCVHAYAFMSGLHLGNNSRGGKIRFYESKGGNSIKICMCKHTPSRGIWRHASQGNFCI